MKAKYLLKGFFKSIPGIEHIYNFHPGTGGTNSARYCYSVWLRHLVKAYENGLAAIPKKIAELGPGDSLGIGISALITGSEEYHALDIIKYTDAGKNLKIFDELVVLFNSRSSIPDDKEFPNMRPFLSNYDFPAHLLTEDHLRIVLDENRLKKIRDSIQAINADDMPGENRMIHYKAPWDDEKIIKPEFADMIFSQAVLQHIDDLEGAYKSMNKWLKKGGLMSHSIDLKSMGSSDDWDGHWTYSDIEWKIVKGRKSYLINREPYTKHAELFSDNGFKIICDIKSVSQSNIRTKKNLASRFRGMSAEDMMISGTFIQAIKERML